VATASRSRLRGRSNRRRGDLSVSGSIGARAGAVAAVSCGAPYAPSTAYGGPRWRGSRGDDELEERDDGELEERDDGELEVWGDDGELEERDDDELEVRGDDELEVRGDDELEEGRRTRRRRTSRLEPCPPPIPPALLHRADTSPPAHLLFIPFLSLARSNNDLPWVPLLVLSRESASPRHLEEKRGRCDFSVLLQETAVGWNPLSVSWGRRIKGPNADGLM
jgi:hypothetical protein